MMTVKQNKPLDLHLNTVGKKKFLFFVPPPGGVTYSYGTKSAELNIIPAFVFK